MTYKRFKKILEPGYIGKVRTRNRMIKTASSSGLIEPDGSVGERIMGWYEALARGGVGMITFETNSVEYPRGSHRPPTTGHLDDDKYIPGYTELVRRVHKYGCPIFLQIVHAGPWFGGNQGIDPGDRIAASPIPDNERPGFILPTRPITTEEVKEIRDKYINTAIRAQKCGFDGIEVNGSHYHFINGFFSRFFNRRHDEYGCDSMENRARFMIEVIQGIKKSCGQDYPVGTLINAAELGLPYGLGTTFEESKQFARMIEAAGADYLQLRNSGFGPYSGDLHTDQFFFPELPEEIMVPELDWSRHGKAINVPLAAMFKKVVTIPVFVASRLDAELGEKFLREGKLDFVGMTRRLIADPEYPNKVAEGRLEDIAPCTGDMFCWETRGANQAFKCRINACLGREYEYAIKPAEKKKKVMIVGGGPAGMEAARVSAMRGHQVVLFDKKPYLGGGLPLAAMVKGTELEDFPAFVRYFKIQLKKLGVKIHLRKTVNETLVRKIHPDVVVIAAGGLPSVMQIPGINSKNVANLDTIHSVLELLIWVLGPNITRKLSKIWMPIGKKVVVIGGQFPGCELAEYMTKTGRKVSMVEKSPFIGEGLVSDQPYRLYKWFDRKGVKIKTEVKYRQITKNGLDILTREGQPQTCEADTVMPAPVLKPNKELFKRLQDTAPEVYLIGDAHEAGLTHHAIAEGAAIGRKI